MQHCVHDNVLVRGFSTHTDGIAGTGTRMNCMKDYRIKTAPINPIPKR